MTRIFRLLATVLVTLCLLTACGESGSDADINTDGTPSTSSANSGEQVSWSTLSELQQGVLSVLQDAWPSIPADEQQELLEKANRWTRMQPREQAEFRESWNQYLAQPLD